ncbi:hypothetical protein GDO81_000374 [Engystomops pustulosus]|uniref:Uncharacterized protein n=1 Tax=Engystomops pustulosus TaxID=76066 RepID=A0AAV7D4Y2_ENGPU|nr:hypothetical protein GDO81_000374 [Engystomops pustulosus]
MNIYFLFLDFSTNREGKRTNDTFCNLDIKQESLGGQYCIEDMKGNGWSFIFSFRWCFCVFMLRNGCFAPILWLFEMLRHSLPCVPVCHCVLLRPICH